jgi:hypothetical protein
VKIALAIHDLEHKESYQGRDPAAVRVVIAHKWKGIFSIMLAFTVVASSTSSRKLRNKTMMISRREREEREREREREREKKMRCAIDDD